MDEKLDNWSVNSDGILSSAKIEKSMDENLDLHPVSLGFEPLANLKQISSSNSMDDNIPYLNLSSEALLSSVPNLSLKEHGFVSPCKANVSKGYFLRSCTKSVQEISRPIKDKPGNFEVDEGLIGDVNVLHHDLRGVGVLRALAINHVHS